MLLVLLGTQKNPFSRLLIEIDKCIENKIINEKVIVQAGYTNYQSNNMEIFDFIPKNEMTKLINEADIIITHGGVGSILTGVKQSKKVIAIPRLQKYNEHVNDHQIQIVKKFDEKGFIIGVLDVSKLEEAIRRTEDFIPARYISNSQNIIKIISDYIEKN